jgi:hypothetical protein
MDWLGHQSSEVGGRRTVIKKGVAPTAEFDGWRGEEEALGEVLIS